MYSTNVNDMMMVINDTCNYVGYIELSSEQIEGRPTLWWWYQWLLLIFEICLDSFTVNVNINIINLYNCLRMNLTNIQYWGG